MIAGAAMDYGGARSRKMMERDLVGGSSSNTLASLSSIIYLNQNLYFSFQNFLRYSVHQHVNIHPDEDGLVKVTFDTTLYSSALIIALDEKSSTQRIVDIQDVPEKIHK